VTGDEVRAATFRDKFRGYHPDEVDALLEKVARELDAGRSPSSLLHNVSFSPKLRGYHPQDVDAARSVESSSLIGLIRRLWAS
jgi:DivIVA domain-containing protein